MINASPAAAANQTTALQAAFRTAMASVCTPVSVVTTLADGLPYGTTVSAFASLSMQPPMLLVALHAGSDLLALVRQTGRFGLNVLSSSQTALAQNFARKGGAGKFSGIPWEVAGTVPRIPEAAGFVACIVHKVVPGGDHDVLFGHVLMAASAGLPPLTYQARVFGTHAPTSAACRD